MTIVTNAFLSEKLSHLPLKLNPNQQISSDVNPSKMPTCDVIDVVVLSWTLLAAKRLYKGYTDDHMNSFFIAVLLSSHYSRHQDETFNLETTFEPQMNADERRKNQALFPGSRTIIIYSMRHHVSFQRRFKPCLQSCLLTCPHSCLLTMKF